MAQPKVLDCERRHFDLAAGGFWWLVRYDSGEPLACLALFPQEATERDVRLTAERSLDAPWECALALQELEQITWH